MGKCQSKKKDAPPDITNELEKTLQQCINEREEYKEKYEEYNKRYNDMKSQLEQSLQTVKTLQRNLKLSEDNASSLYRRYAIESDLNKRLQQQISKEKYRYESLPWRSTGCGTYDICERLEDFEARLSHMELILKDTNDSYNDVI